VLDPLRNTFGPGKSLADRALGAASLLPFVGWAGHGIGLAADIGRGASVAADVAETVTGATRAAETGTDASASISQVYRSAGPGLDIGPPSRISLDQARAAAERNGIDMRMFDLEYEHPDDFNANKFGFMSYKGTGEIVRSATGRFVITLTDTGLRSELDAVETIAHELNHVRSVLQYGPDYISTEQEAEFGAEALRTHFR